VWPARAATTLQDSNPIAGCGRPLEVAAVAARRGSVAVWRRQEPRQWWAEKISEYTVIIC
jgi:hypothetical protein